MTNKKIELLAPAGDLERLKINLLYGADAVYFGGKKYSLRANASNFGLEEIKEACDFAHKLGKKVFLTLNIVFHNEDIEGVEEYIKQVVECGIDAFIISDPFIINHIVTNYPNVEAHLSTQNSTTNKDTVLFFKEQGVKRVVLAREVSLNEMKEIIDETQTDIEVFIHGAMCTFYSGRCCLSNYVTNRDSNRGGCAQICRFAYNLEEDDSNDTKFTMATKDLNLSRHIKDLIDIGVTSLKVEGRMRSLYYTATVIGTYRKIIDYYYENREDKEYLEEQYRILDRVANRETSSHYLLKKADHTDQYYTGRQELSNQDFLGLIKGYDKDKKILTLTERNYFKLGDIVELFTPSGRTYAFTIDKMYNENMEEIDTARHPEEIINILVDIPFEVEEYSMMRIKV
ncbi:MAG: U32 family peptidase [Firmicutes bacterium]|nr:U32 family peptidase [Bacillota bacterium]